MPSMNLEFLDPLSTKSNQYLTCTLVTLTMSFIEPRVSIVFYSPLQGRGVVEDAFYAGFTPYANILHSYRALRLNSMRRGGPSIVGATNIRVGLCSLHRTNVSVVFPLLRGDAGSRHLLLFVSSCCVSLCLFAYA